MISSFLRTMIWVTASLSEHHLHLHQTHAKRENWGREVYVWIEQWNLEKHSFLPPALHPIPLLALGYMLYALHCAANIPLCETGA
uniref:Putative secreted protein n=1 Tax=Anopheles darlingi TaxID=43151 RepID=A0A2M4D7Z3_ANODA